MSMKLVIIGYGKMGRQIERIALEQGWSVEMRIRRTEELSVAALGEMDVAIEFSRPEAAFDNISCCLEAGVPVVCGTTGWTERLPEAHDLCRRLRGAFLYASNFSIGVNLFFAVNRHLANLMDRQPGYGVAIEETHHLQKRDHPSGTALTLAQGIVRHVGRYEGWVPMMAGGPREDLSTSDFPVVSHREGDVPGTHGVIWTSATDSITLRHTAFNRQGFAAGALLAARWLVGREGCFGMVDVLQPGTGA
ncbi:MAG: hypothetical protein RLY31_2003 [Bacteroidota bacterium]